MQNPVKCSQVLTFSTMWKTLEVHRFLRGFSQGLSQVFSEEKNSQGFSQGFACVLTLWKIPCSQVLTFSTMWKTLKGHRFLRGFSQRLSQVSSEGKNSQGFSQGFAWVLTLWKMPCSQGLNSFTPCEKGVKNMWNWTVHRFFTAFSLVFMHQRISSHWSAGETARFVPLFLLFHLVNCCFHNVSWLLIGKSE